MIRVAIFDDHKVLRESLRVLIDNTEDMYCCGAFPDCSQLLKNIAQARPDVILLDIQMPGVSGIEALPLIRKAHPEIHILMQTVFEDDDKIFAAVCNGASGYILKKPDRLFCWNTSAKPTKAEPQ